MASNSNSFADEEQGKLHANFKLSAGVEIKLYIPAGPSDQLVIDHKLAM